jgi:hypothetical protein
MLVRAVKQVEFQYGQRQRRLEVGETIDAGAIHPRELKAYLDAGTLVEDEPGAGQAPVVDEGGEETGEKGKTGKERAGGAAAKGRAKGAAAK